MSKVEKKKKRINKILSIGKGGKVEVKRRNETEVIGACSFFLRLLGRGCTKTVRFHCEALVYFFSSENVDSPCSFFLLGCVISYAF